MIYCRQIFFCDCWCRCLLQMPAEDRWWRSWMCCSEPRVSRFVLHLFRLWYVIFLSESYNRLFKISRFFQQSEYLENMSFCAKFISLLHRLRIQIDVSKLLRYIVVTHHRGFSPVGNSFSSTNWVMNSSKCWLDYCKSNYLIPYSFIANYRYKSRTRIFYFWHSFIFVVYDIHKLIVSK